MIKKTKKIYYLLRKTEAIKPVSGDSITELGIILALSKYHDVYYNDQLFRPNEPDYGLTSKKINRPTRKYDLHIVRNNPSMFNSIRGRKVYFATPYDERAFREADNLYTFTDSWTNKLKDGYDFPYNAYPKGYTTDKAITINQVISDDFFKNTSKEHYKTRRIRKKFGGEFVIGHFGRVSDSCYPHSFLKVISRIKKVCPNLSVIFCGNSDRVKAFGHKHGIKILNFNYNQMPHAISACDMILYNYRDGQGHIAGSMKILEAMARGVPILCPKYDARVYELGDDYELFYPYEDICATNAAPTQDRFSNEIERKMFRIIKRGIDEPNWLKGIGAGLKVRAEYYSVDKSASRFKRLLDDISE